MRLMETQDFDSQADRRGFDEGVVAAQHPGGLNLLAPGQAPLGRCVV
ncbi:MULTISPECIES: hypothetical protein [Streptomyces]|uniref:Uncharacterized protein n=1 Tax=Streptomyces antimycoticus TaxID=68175 RepID=A0ABD5J3V5_9ACTN|nr:MULTISPECIES: hypothetical protein [Streptomyces]MEE4583016.1 hypothetical protein [Streptomyces sp. DSM 41602]QTI88064.1 hypothetical protein AS97_45260 [Streptomyces sp. AgN23]WTA80360.1 hypothetical protein OG751_10625 [Streptomyces antimycoticus]WTB09450.1 hypothetical protein OG546_37950 [Streptomyces antimycoticus]